MRWTIVVLLLAAGLALTGAAPASARPWTGRYTVHAGDSLTAIARHYGVSFQQLAAANGLDWRKPLLIGVVLRVPVTGSTAATRSGWAGTYVVRPGDTLSEIALRYSVSLEQLASANEIDPAKLLLIGARLRIPAIGTAIPVKSVGANPYRQGAVGYDVSYPNCDAPVPASGSFAIIGLNGGRPFTANPCFAAEWATAQEPRSVYLNTAYSPKLFKHLTPACRAAGRSQALAPDAQSAYALGCSEASVALGLLSTQPAAIWLDVEPDNSWSSRFDLNAATIQGILDHLLAQPSPPPVGIYSSAAFWHDVVGDLSMPALPEWVTTAVPVSGCAPSFAGGPVWLTQIVTDSIDVNRAC